MSECIAWEKNLFSVKRFYFLIKNLMFAKNNPIPWKCVSNDYILLAIIKNCYSWESLLLGLEIKGILGHSMKSCFLVSILVIWWHWTCMFCSYVIGQLKGIPNNFYPWRLNSTQGFWCDSSKCVVYLSGLFVSGFVFICVLRPHTY